MGPVIRMGVTEEHPFNLGCLVKRFKHFYLIVVVLTMVNVYSVKASAWLLTWLSSIKTLALAFIIVLGVWKLIENGIQD